MQSDMLAVCLACFERYYKILQLNCPSVLASLELKCVHSI
jgi:hypothetical protein